MALEAYQGRLVGGRYRLVKALHSGGFGRVWQARDLSRDVDVAVKEVWLPPAISDAERADRLTRAEREARNAARLRNHPNIVTVRDVVQEDGAPWIIMQLVTGHSLAEDIAASGPLSADQVRYVADNLLKALGTAHNAGIVHRDVKPANVMFTETGEVLLTDFGIAIHEADTTLTATGMLVGSVDYMAPERIRGKDNTAAGDMFSLGVTLYQAVTGVSPFHRDMPAASLAAILFEDPPPPRCPPGLSALIVRLLAKDPAQRPTVSLARGLLAAQPKGGTPARTLPARPRTRLVAQPEPAAAAPRPRLPTRVAPAPVPPPKQLRQRPPSVPAPWQTRRRTRRRSGVSIAALVVLGFIGAHAVWGRDASSATAGDCVYHRQHAWYLDPCSLPLLWQDTANYKVVQRLEGTSGQCTAAPGRPATVERAVLTGYPQVTLCLAPLP
ncbi:MAG TPA: serine/threonine-protein kinase [Pseudonocardiaceae bacterium]|nr:serine/threonine-protein kinase [Pseudonocardiaceae bacterium]